MDIAAYSSWCGKRAISPYVVQAIASPIAILRLANARTSNLMAWNWPSSAHHYVWHSRRFSRNGPNYAQADARSKRVEHALRSASAVKAEEFRCADPAVTPIYAVATNAAFEELRGGIYFDDIGPDWAVHDDWPVWVR